MPEKYNYKEDMKLHTRYSELSKCTEKGVLRVVGERQFDMHQTNPYTEFGSLRHEVFANFLRKHCKLPKKVRECGYDLEINQDFIEREYSIEVWKNVIIHLTPDLHNLTWVADFKTTTKGIVNYRNDKQIIFYAWLLNKLGCKIDKGYYICEVWDRDRTQIKGYEVLEREITPEEIEFIEEWAKERVERLFKELTKEVYCE